MAQRRSTRRRRTASRPRTGPGVASDELEERIRQEGRQPGRDRHLGEPAEERNGQAGRDDQPAPQVRQVSGACLVALGPRLARCLRIDGPVGRGAPLDARHVPGSIDGRERARRYRSRVRVEAHGRRLGGEVDVRLLDTVDLREEARDPVDARTRRSCPRRGTTRSGGGATMRPWPWNDTPGSIWDNRHPGRARPDTGRIGVDMALADRRSAACR